jgi:hypothetical protein
MDNPEKTATPDTQDEDKQNKKHTTIHKQTQMEGYTNVLKIDLKCPENVRPEKYIKAYIFFFYYPMDWVQI